jgi:hypothetical protein
VAHPYHHSLSSCRQWGGKPEDFQHLHEWFDASKALAADYRHRALRHHAFGIFELERTYGATLTLSTGKVIPTRWVGEQHVREDLGRIPCFSEWVRAIRPEPWMGRAATLGLEDDPRPRKPKSKCRYSAGSRYNDDETYTAEVHARPIPVGGPATGNDVLVWSCPGFASSEHALCAADQEAKRRSIEGEGQR